MQKYKANKCQVNLNNSYKNVSYYRIKNDHKKYVYITTQRK